MGTLQRVQDPASPVTIQSSGSSISNNAASTGDTWDNTSTGDDAAAFELNAGFGSTPTIGNTIGLYGVPAVDNTNYGDVDTSSSPPTLNPNNLLGTFEVLKASTSAERMTLLVNGLLPIKYKFYLGNTSGQTVSSTWALKANFARYQY
jgi:hypothetical protein